MSSSLQRPITSMASSTGTASSILESIVSNSLRLEENKENKSVTVNNGGKNRIDELDFLSTGKFF